jgi:hypothetical protein
MDPGLTDYEGGCHCGAVRFRVTLVKGLRKVLRCNCSMCRMRGAVVALAPLDGLEIVRGQDALGHYQFNTGVAHHYFCSKCGIYTHHQRRANPEQYAVNVACLDGVSPFDFDEVPVYDGVHHPRDDPQGRSFVAGTLSFRPDARERQW